MLITKEMLEELIEENLSIVSISKRLGVTTSVTRNRLSKFNLKTKASYFNKRTWTDEQLIIAVEESFTNTEVITKLGLSSQASGNWRTVNKYIKLLNLNTSHFYGQSWVSNPRRDHPRKYEIEDILIENSIYTGNLLKRLINEGTKEAQCEKCNLVDWLGEKLSFELDHINGNNTDNRIENLRVLCPNCHAQTPTWRRSKTNAIAANLSLCFCGDVKDAKAETCRKCFRNNLQINLKVIYPSLEQIKEDYKNVKTFVGLGKMYGVSDNAVRKHLRRNNIDLIDFKNSIKSK